MSFLPGTTYLRSSLSPNLFFFFKEMSPINTRSDVSVVKRLVLEMGWRLGRKERGYEVARQTLE